MVIGIITIPNSRVWIPQSSANLSGNGWSFDTATGTLTISADEGTTNWQPERGFVDLQPAEDVRTAIIQSGVTSINRDTFLNCVNLTSITISNSVTSINRSAFLSCPSLTSINVVADNAHFSSSDGVLFNKNQTEIVKYPQGRTNNSYVIPDTVTRIGESAFAFCSHLTSVTIPDNVISIDADTFLSCKNLISVTIGRGVSSINGSAFRLCQNLTSINVVADNTHFSSSDGVLFNKNQTEIIKYPQGKANNSYTIPNGVTHIRDSAFLDLRASLTSITIPI
jgi:hypothetical protein